MKGENKIEFMRSIRTLELRMIGSFLCSVYVSFLVIEIKLSSLICIADMHIVFYVQIISRIIITNFQS